MTKHFWRRFLETSEDTQTNKKDGDFNQIPAEPTELPEDEDYHKLEGVKSIDTPLKPIHRPRNFKIKPLDIALNDNLNIYEPDKKMMEELERGVVLTISNNEDIYCLVCRRIIKNSLQYIYQHFRSKIHSVNLRKRIDDHWVQGRPDQLSNLTFAGIYIERFPESDVKCHACGEIMKNHSIILLQHMNDPSHIEKCSSLRAKSVELFNTLSSRIKPNFYNSQKYWCVPCKMDWTVEIEFREHLRTEKHERTIECFKNEIMMFDYCPTCATLWYGFLKTFNYHSTCKMHRYHASSHFYLVDKIPHSAERLLHEGERKLEEILTNLDCRRCYDKEKEDQLMKDLERICKKKHPFGSRITGVGGQNSDLDIFLDCGTNNCSVYSEEGFSRDQILLRLKNIQQCLKGDVETWYIDRVIQDCRVPIIKATHRPTGIECDLSFTNGLTVENTKMIKAYCESYPHCRKLIIFVKKWMEHCDITGVHGFNSYGITWLVIYFLQVKRILPTVSELIERRRESRIIGGWETGVCTDFEVCDNDESFRELVIQFFQFYGAFDYRNQVICPLVGRAIEKRDFQRPEVLPPMMKPYLDYLKGEDDREAFRVNTVICLQDPFDLAHNVCKAVPKFVVHKFKTLCSLSAGDAQAEDARINKQK